MAFLDTPEPDDTEQPSEPEEVSGTNDDSGDSAEDDQAAKMPEFEGRKKEIDDFRKDLRSDPGATTLIRGSITIKLGEIRDGNEDAANDLWELVMDQLELTATKALRSFSRLGMDPHDLINDVFPRLSAKLADEEIKNRQHFYGLASINFRWAILKGLRKNRIPTKSIEEAANVPDPAPRHDEILEKDDLYFYIILAMDHLSDKSKELIDLVFFMGFPVAEVAEELGIGRRTAYDRYDRALDELTTVLKNLPDDIED